MPKLYIIAGCNGAGKTTASYTVLPEMLSCKEFVNADEIAKGLSPFNPESVAIEAGRLMLSRIDELMNSGVDFAFETTLATRSYAGLVHQAKAKGYGVTLLFFWLNTPELAVERVAQRVAAGGHNIAEDVIRRRYVKGIHNLFNIYMEPVDYWILVDNSESPFELIAEHEKSEIKQIYNTFVYKAIEQYGQKRG
jgi:predicted ABC-type ATPase